MRTASLPRRCALALPLVLAATGACGSMPDKPETASVSATDAVEAGRVQKFLDERYTSKDVRYSFRTGEGEYVDCVDFFAAPGVKAMAAQGKPITLIPKPPPLPESMKKKDAEVARRGAGAKDPSFHGQPDLDGNPQKCPEGSYPESRITAEQVSAAGGLDAFLRPYATKSPPPGTAYTCSADNNDFAHVVNTLFDGTTPGVEFGSSTMAIYAPSVPLPSSVQGDHSLSQMWLYSGSNTKLTSPNGTCTSDCVQSIEIGWDVDPALHTNDRRPYLFMFSTSNGYVNGCYDNVSSTTGAPCVPWIPSPSAAYGFTTPLPYNPPANTGGQDPQPYPVELTTTIIDISGNYWIAVQVGAGQSSYIGYFPGSNYSQPFDTFQVGGEIDDGTNKFMNSGVAMGSGNPPAEGYGWSAYHHDYSAAVYANGQTTWAGNGTMCATRPADYSYSTTGAGGSWSNYFYYGGNPACTVTTCQAKGDRCGTIDNGCGTPISCGSCAPGYMCVANKLCEKRIIY